MGVPSISNSVTVGSTTLGVFDITYTDSVDNKVASSVTVEIDTADTFNTANKVTSIFSNVASGNICRMAKTLAVGVWYWRVTAVNADGTTVTTTQMFTIINTIKRVLYHYENVGKYNLWNNKRTLYQYENVGKLNILKKRVLYHYENVAKLNVWTKERALYQYENITSDPPTPFIESLSSYRGPAGSIVKITGDGFGYSPNIDLTNVDRYQRCWGGFVYIGSLLCSVMSWNWQEIIVQLPVEAVSGAIRVELTTPMVRVSNVKGFEIYEGQPTDDIGIEMFICDRFSPNTVLCQLDGAYNKAFQMLQNNPGSGNFTISRYDEKGGNRNYIADQNYVLVKLDGVTMFKWLIEKVEPSYIDDSEKQEIKVSGRGVLAMLNRAVVYPENMASPVLDREFTGNAGTILRTLLLEAQNRGGLTGISVEWDAGFDSIGNPFTDDTQVKFHVGTPLLEVVTKFTEGLGLFDIDLSPDLRLKIYKSKGVDLSSTAIYRPGQAIVSHQNQNDATAIVNEVLVEGAGGQLAISSHSDSQFDFGRREGYLSASNMEGGLSEYGQAYMKRSAYPKWGIQGKIIEFEDYNGNKLKPFETYLIGDWIGWKIPPEGSDLLGFDETLRVKGITVNEDNETGMVDYTLELNSVMLEHEIRLSQLVNRISQYTGVDVLSTAPGSGSGGSATKSQIESVLTGTITTHNHDDFYYSKTAMDLILAGYALTNHIHSNYASDTHNHNEIYYTKTAMDLILAGYALANHNHDIIYAGISHAHATLYAPLSHSHSFLSLTDTPDSFVADKYVKINSAGNAIEFVDAPAGGGAAKTGTGIITTSGWVANNGDYAYKLDLAISGIVSTDILSIAIDKDNIDDAVTCNLCPTSDTYDGGVTFYAKTTPTNTISFTYTTITSSMVLPSGGTTGQALVKNSDDNFDIKWGTISGGSGSSYQNAIDQPPASPHAKDDEFTATTLDSKWGWVNQGSTTYSLTECPGFLKIKCVDTSDDQARWLVQDRPAGDFTVIAKISSNICKAFALFGIGIMNPTSGASVMMGCHTRTDWQRTVGHIQWSGFGSGAGAYLAYMVYGSHIYVKMKVVGTSVTMQVSFDGNTWSPVLYTFTITSSHTKIGFTCNSESSQQFEGVCDWFRVTEP